MLCMDANQSQTVAHALFPRRACAGKSGWATSDYPHRPGTGMEPLLDAIVEHVPTPPLHASGPFRMLTTMIEHDTFLGRIATGRVAAGRAAVGDPIWLLPREGGPPEPGKARPSHAHAVNSRVKLSEVHHHNC